MSSHLLKVASDGLGMNKYPSEPPRCFGTQLRMVLLVNRLTMKPRLNGSGDGIGTYSTSEVVSFGDLLWQRGPSPTGSQSRSQVSPPHC